MILLAQITSQAVQPVAETGIGIGSALAMICSWHRNRSLLWAILAALFSWLYVIHFEMSRRPDERK